MTYVVKASVAYIVGFEVMRVHVCGALRKWGIRDSARKVCGHRGQRIKRGVHLFSAIAEVLPVCYTVSTPLTNVSNKLTNEAVKVENKSVSKL